MNHFTFQMLLDPNSCFAANSCFVANVVLKSVIFAGIVIKCITNIQIYFQPNVGMLQYSLIPINARYAMFQATHEVLVTALVFGQKWREVGLPHPIPIACVGCGNADKVR